MHTGPRGTTATRDRQRAHARRHFQGRLHLNGLNVSQSFGPLPDLGKPDAMDEFVWEQGSQDGLTMQPRGGERGNCGRRAKPGACTGKEKKRSSAPQAQAASQKCSVLPPRKKFTCGFEMQQAASRISVRWIEAGVT